MSDEIELTEDEKVFGNVTWNDIFSREYWDIKYQHRDIPWKGERIGNVQTRQEYPRDVCLKIIDRILDNQEKAKKYDEHMRNMHSCGTLEIQWECAKRNQKLRELIENEIDKIKNQRFTLNDGHIDQFNNWAVNLLQKLLEESKK